MTSAKALRREAKALWRPPPRLNLSQWADEHFYLSAESSAEAGRWKTLPYQVGIMNAITDPAVEKISFMKSARVGATKMMNAAIGYYIHQDPCPIMIVQPTLDDAKGYSKEELSPMLRDVPVLSGIFPESTTRDSTDTILHKLFPGGSLSVVGANSGRGFRRVSRKVVLFDEVDGYPPSAGTEGDQIKLGTRRSDYYWDRKIVAASTPGVAGRSRIAALFEEGDQRRYYVPCPHCDQMDFLVFREGERGHYMKWPKNKPEEAHFVCRGCGGIIEHSKKREIVARGEWRADAPFNGHASFHVWAAYSYSPNATWAHIAQEFLQAQRQGPEILKTFVNTWLGECWQDRGDAPDWERLYTRRERRAPGTIPAEVKFLTAGVDVQRDRLVWEVVGWGDNKQSWSIDAGVFPGDTSVETNPVWKRLDDLLAQMWARGDEALAIAMLAVDSGFNTNTVYSWARRYPMARVIATKGSATAQTIIGSPSPVDVTIRGKRLSRGYKVWPVGVNVAKAELYGWLRLEPPKSGSGEPFPSGYCSFPEYDEDFFKQITAEHLVPVVKRTGYTTAEWQLIPGRENHWLDARIYARAAAMLMGMDRVAAARQAQKQAAPQLPPATTRAPEPPAAKEAPPEKKASSGWLGGRGAGLVRGNWWKRR